MIPFPNGRIFVYGSLMFPEVVKALVGAPLPVKPATVKKFERLAIQRGPGKAKGPVCFPTDDESSTVTGKLIEGADEPIQRILNLFELAAGGYDLIVVKVQLEDADTEVEACMYVGRPRLRPMAGGAWSAKEFEEDHLRTYIDVRIPQLLAEWEQQGLLIDERSALRPSMSIEEKQVLYLKRNWEILEGFKRTRSRLPLAVSGASVAIAGFALKSEPSSEGGMMEILATALVIVTISAFGWWMMNVVESQYKYTDGKIENLYRQLGMDMSEASMKFRDSNHSRPEQASDIFAMMRYLIAGVGLLTATLVLLKARALL